MENFGGYGHGLKGAEMYTDELRHHGILGQRWGNRNGPPYPLDASQHSPREKRLGWRKSLDKKSDLPYNKGNRSKNQNKGVKSSDKRGLTENQKRAIIIGASAAAAAIAAYGVYKLKKSGKLDELIDRGKAFAERKLGKTAKLNGEPQTIKRLSKPESVEQVLQNTNPTHGRENCYKCVVAATLRTCGLDVTATEDEPGRGEVMAEFAKVFKLNPDNGKDVITIGSPTVERFERNILKRYKEGDVGAIGFQWDGTKTDNSDPGGHTVNWMLQNGKVRFFDPQTGKDTDYVRSVLSAFMSNRKTGELARFANILDGISDPDIDIGLLKKYVR